DRRTSVAAELESAVFAGVHSAGRTLRRRRSRVQHAGEVAASAMISAPTTIRTGLLLAALALTPSASCLAQDSSTPSPSLGDVARCTRKAHASADHVPAKQGTDEDVDGPDAGGVWRVELCVQTPCYEFAI